MTEFHRAHAAIFDELERQGFQGIDVARLTAAVLTATKKVATLSSSGPYQRCANGVCDE